MAVGRQTWIASLTWPTPRGRDAVYPGAPSPGLGGGRSDGAHAGGGGGGGGGGGDGGWGWRLQPISSLWRGATAPLCRPNLPEFGPDIVAAAPDSVATTPRHYHDTNTIHSSSARLGGHLRGADTSIAKRLARAGEDKSLRNDMFVGMPQFITHVPRA